MGVFKPGEGFDFVFGEEGAVTNRNPEQIIELRLSNSELVLLNNALNEVLHGIEVPEFDTRLGATREFAKTLLKKISDSLDKT